MYVNCIVKWAITKPITFVTLVNYRFISSV